jgi:hypothetical protein
MDARMHPEMSGFTLRDEPEGLFDWLSSIMLHVDYLYVHIKACALDDELQTRTAQWILDTLKLYISLEALTLFPDAQTNPWRGQDPQFRLPQDVTEEQAERICSNMYTLDQILSEIKYTTIPPQSFVNTLTII